MPLWCAMQFESHTPKSIAMRKTFFASDAKPLLLHKKVIILPQKAPAKFLQCWPAMPTNSHVLGHRAMRNVCGSDSRCGLACDATACDAKSLAIRVERCEPLRPSLNAQRPWMPGGTPDPRNSSVYRNL